MTTPAPFRWSKIHFGFCVLVKRLAQSDPIGLT